MRHQWEMSFNIPDNHTALRGQTKFKWQPISQQLLSYNIAPICPCHNIKEPYGHAVNISDIAGILAIYQFYS